MGNFAQSDNPFLQSRALWNDLYGDVQIKLENAYRVIFILAVVIVIAMISMVVMASQSHVKPYLTVLHGSDVLTVRDTESTEFATLQPKLAELLARQFIQHARAVSSDATMNTQHQIHAFAHVAGPAVTWLKTQFQHDPSDEEPMRHVIVDTVLMKSEKTLDVRWSEDTLDAKSGERLNRQHYSAELNFTFQPPSNDTSVAEHNPLGFYITHILVAKDRVPAEENS